MNRNGQEPEPLTIAQIEAVALLQVSKWKMRKQSLSDDEIDNLMEAPVAYQLLADQAQLFADLIGRVE